MARLLTLSGGLATPSRVANALMGVGARAPSLSSARMLSAAAAPSKMDIIKQVQHEHETHTNPSLRGLEIQRHTVEVHFGGVK